MGTSPVRQTWLTGGQFDGEKIDAGGASVDQIAAKHFRGKTLLPSLELSVRGEGIFTSSLPRNSISWVDPLTPAPRDIDPRVVFDRMFRSGKSGLSDRSLVDLVLEDARDLKRRVSQADESRIDEYLESVRAIERRLEFAELQKQRASQTPGLENALRRPEAEIPSNHHDYMRTMLDMIVLAFWSDATRVCTFMMDHGQSNRYFDFIDSVRGTWHALSHWKDISGRTEDDDGKTSWKSKDEKTRHVQSSHELAYRTGRVSASQARGNQRTFRSIARQQYGCLRIESSRRTRTRREKPSHLAGRRTSVRYPARKTIQQCAGHLHVRFASFRPPRTRCEPGPLRRVSESFVVGLTLTRNSPYSPLTNLNS